MPRRLIAVIAYSAVPGFPIETVPAIRSGSCVPNMPANGPSVPGGSARVSSRAWSTSVSSCSSTRSESYILRTFQSMPPPISDAISFGVRTTESGPAEVRRLPTLAFPRGHSLGCGGADRRVGDRRQGRRAAEPARAGLHDRLAKPPHKRERADHEDRAPELED